MARNRQVAALPWRRGVNGVEILMITTRTTRRWVIPKGWLMPGKADHEAAAIEAFEEAGVRGKISQNTCGEYNYEKLSDKGNARAITVVVYPMHVVAEFAEWPERHERERRWMGVAEAADIAGEPELAPLLRGFVSLQTEAGLWRRLWRMLVRA